MTYERVATYRRRLPLECRTKTAVAGLLMVLGGSGCGDQLVVGSEILWLARYESGGPDEWEVADAGGHYADAFDATALHTVEVTPEHAHAGTFAAKLTRQSSMESSGPGLFRNAALPREAYYSAWYLVPEQYTTVTPWSIMKFMSLNPDTPGQLGQGVDLNLRSLPGGGYVLVVFDHDRTYLEAPVANPPPLVELDRWFHLEVRFSVGSNRTGSVEVWFDGRKVHELDNRSTVGSAGLHFTVCNVSGDELPAPRSLFVDDTVISRTRATPSAILTSP